MELLRINPEGMVFDCHSFFYNSRDLGGQATTISIHYFGDSCYIYKDVFLKINNNLNKKVIYNTKNVLKASLEYGVVYNRLK